MVYIDMLKEVTIINDQIHKQSIMKLEYKSLLSQLQGPIFGEKMYKPKSNSNLPKPLGIKEFLGVERMIQMKIKFYIPAR